MMANATLSVAISATNEAAQALPVYDDATLATTFLSSYRGVEFGAR